jgi:outer membrane protein assembly factor BamA
VDAVDSPFDVSDPSSVPGFGKTYNVLSARLKLELDTRSPDRVFTPGSGLRLEAFSSFNINPDDPDLLFVRWGGEIAGFLDLSGLNHVLALRIYSEILEKIGNTPVPITELISLGGSEYLRGFLGGRFRGGSALEITFDYRYPIHTYLDANLFAGIGNVFDGRLAKLSLRKMVMSWGIGVRTNTSRNVSFDIMFALGTNQLGKWDEEFKVDNIRFVVGINQGF